METEHRRGPSWSDLPTAMGHSIEVSFRDRLGISFGFAFAFGTTPFHVVEPIQKLLWRREALDLRCGLDVRDFAPFVGNHDCRTLNSWHAICRHDTFHVLLAEL